MVIVELFHDNMKIKFPEETAEDSQVKDFGKNYQLKKFTNQKKNMGPYKLLQPPRRWSRPHEPTSIMANAQQKMKKKI